MFDRVCVFTLTGVVLWSSEIEPLREGVVSNVVKDVLLPSKSGVNSYDSGASGYITRWAVSNAHGIVAAAVLAKSLANSVPYAGSLVTDLRDAFVKRYGERLVAAGKAVLVQDAGRSAAASTLAAACAGASVVKSQSGFASFDNEYSNLLSKYEGRRKPVVAMQQPADAPASQPAAAPATPTRPTTQDAGQPSQPSDAAADDVVEDEDIAETAISGGDRMARLAALKARAKARPGARRVSGPTASPGSAAKKGKAEDEAKGSAKKAARTWDDFSYSDQKAGSLDKSKDKDSGAGASGGAGAVEAPVTYSGTGASGSGADLVLDDDSSSEPSSSWLGSAGSWMSSLTGGKPLTRGDLQPVVDSLRGLLQSKNVATEVAEDLCDSVASQLEGTKLDGGMNLLGGTAGKVTAAVTGALRSSIERVLTPTAPVDILREVRAKRAAQDVSGKGKGARDPYVIVFCGVNGVGKSTTLSKVAFHLKDHGHSVLLAACDSFRAGAVEQLKKHAERLSIPLHEAGYAKDPVVIAADAIRKARAEDVHVVLVDTAGRMQNNTQLMMQLAKLVAVNSPDRVLFVGEALVGNDGVDQLLEFNRALTDLSQDGGRGAAIHGIVLTKFDTVDDKVGAALSMTHKTGIPIVFLGVGQQYPDLRKLNTAAVVKALLAA